MSEREARDEADAGVLVPRPAATVCLVRGGDTALEVLLLQRNPQLVFAGGAYAFPGGALEEVDALAAISVAGRDDESTSALLGLPAGGLAYWVAAVRECFEEIGVLLALDREGNPVRPDRLARVAARRDEVAADHRIFAELLRAEGLVVDAGALRAFAHMITPPHNTPRRFDTRFFVAPMPDGQEPAHDGGEFVDARWAHPRAALDAFAAGELLVIPPTERALRAMAPFETASELLAALDGIDVRPDGSHLLADIAGVRLAVAVVDER